MVLGENLAEKFRSVSFRREREKPTLSERESVFAGEDLLCARISFFVQGTRLPLRMPPRNPAIRFAKTGADKKAADCELVLRSRRMRPHIVQQHLTKLDFSFVCMCKSRFL